MRIEAILSVADLEHVLRQFLPVQIALGGEEDGDIALSDPSSVSLVADVGLRVVCKAKLHWPVLGIAVPVTMHSLAVLLKPELVNRDDGERLVFKLEVEHADLAGVPSFMDRKITDRVNEALAEKHVELAWNFGESLTHSFSLPSILKPLEAFRLEVAGARVVVTKDALGLAIGFRASVTRNTEPTNQGSPS